MRTVRTWHGDRLSVQPTLGELTAESAFLGRPWLAYGFGSKHHHGMDIDSFQRLQTDRLCLSCVAPQDAEVTAAMMTPETSREVAYWPTPFTFDMKVVRIEASRQSAHVGNALPFAVTKRASGELIGWIVLNRRRDDRHRGSFGYWLGEKHYGNGYMREAAPVALAAGFRLLDLDVIEAAAQPGNATSFAVVRACGMRPASQGIAFAPASGRDGLCEVYRMERPQ